MHKYLPIYSVFVLASAAGFVWFLADDISIPGQGAQVYSSQTAGFGASTYGSGLFGIGSESPEDSPEDPEVSERENNTQTSATRIGVRAGAESELQSSENVEDYLPTRNISFIQPQYNEIEEVMKLERFLNTYQDESLAVDGVYDSMDNEAMRQFQQKYSSEILEVWDLDEPTGFVGVTSRFKMRFLLNDRTAECPVFTEYNGGLIGINESEEIVRTQELLRDIDLYRGPIHGVWDHETHVAMVRFQESFREVMLDPWGEEKGTGFKYKTTNKFLNYLAGCETDSVFLEGVGEYRGI